MKTTFDLPDEIIRQIKLRAVVQGRTVKDFVADLLRQGLGMAASTVSATPPAGSLVEIGESGLPLIRCRPDAASTRMSAEELLKLEQDTQALEDSQHAGIAR